MSACMTGAWRTCAKVNTVCEIYYNKCEYKFVSARAILSGPIAACPITMAMKKAPGYRQHGHKFAYSLSKTEHADLESIPWRPEVEEGADCALFADGILRN